MTDTLSSASYSISPEQAEQLEQIYNFKRSSEIWQFLQENAFVIPLLLEAPTYVYRQFPDAAMFLEVLVHPQGSASDDDEMVIHVTTQLEADDALDRLWELDRDWWLKASETVAGRLIIDIDFQEV
ncbi:MAG: hypothetical protein KME15_00265 [Drouetiella hepatica Uher 2000/2452]|jgi:hypothetical protein|uniref:Uncharacterized protein n=1 Tax=Drouetiella hepatica Uher 2000/2452 TaxID=904376 RepID=A0A951Q8F3_9CYAN|nr:hypothetical protein [Drouetiella hepatica Uher 2000/2452]